MDRTQETQFRKERGILAKEFLNSDFFKKFLLPHVETERITAYPEPTAQGWEDTYRYAYAKDEVYTRLFTAVANWGKEFDAIVKKESGGVPDIIDA